MEISRKTDYALRMLALLVEHEGEIVSVREAAEKNEVPYSFARSIQHDLSNEDIVESVRGAHGGMKLKADPAKLTLREIVEAVQGPIFISGCMFAGEDSAPCPRLKDCFFNPVWCNAERMLRAYFSSVTLKDIVVDGRIPEAVYSFNLVEHTLESA